MKAVYKNVGIEIGNSSFIAESVSLTISHSVSPIFQSNDKYTNVFKNTASFVETNVDINYTLQPGDIIKSLLFNEEGFRCYIGGVLFTKGFVSKYSLDIESNNPIKVSASLRFWDKPVGNISQNHIPEENSTVFFNSANITISDTDGVWPANHGVNRISYNHTNTLVPVSYVKTIDDTNGAEIGNVTPDRVFISQSDVDVSINGEWIDSASFPLNGDRLVAKITFNDPNTSATDNILINGVISTRNSEVNTKGVLENSISITQNIFQLPPEIYGSGAQPFTPNTEVYVNCTNLYNIRELKINNQNVSDYRIDGDQLFFTLPKNAISGLLYIKSDGGDVYSGIGVTPAPISITALSAYYGKYNDRISIYGENFYDISNVRFGNVNCDYFEVINDQFIFTTVPKLASQNYVYVESELRGLTAQSSIKFLSRPVITGFRPTNGDPGDTIDILGYNFTPVEDVKFNGLVSPNINIVDDTLIEAEVPEGNIFGQIGIFTENDIASYSYAFFEPKVLISGFSINSPEPDVEINISGKNFYSPYLHPYTVENRFAVLFPDNKLAPFEVVNNILLKGKTPLDFKAGNVYIVKPDGAALYTGYYPIGKDVLAPTVTAMNNSIAFSGQPFYTTLNGQDLNLVSGLRFVGITPLNLGAEFIIDESMFYKNSQGTNLFLTNYIFEGVNITGTYDLYVTASGDKTTVFSVNRLNLLSI